MKAGIFVKRCIAVCFVLILFSCCFLGKASGENLPASIDEVTCSDVIVKVFTECPSGDKTVSLSECSKQHFVFFNKKTGKSTEVKCAGKTVAHFGPDGRPLGNHLDALAHSWACVEGRDGWYLLIMYTTGGTCEGCEWAEIYSLQGDRLATDRMQSKRKGAGKYGSIEDFKETYKRLGLPEPWPREALKDIELFKADR